MPENPGETSGGDSTTAPPEVDATPGGQTDVAPVPHGGPDDTAGGSTEELPDVEATPGGQTDVAPVGHGGPDDPAAGSTEEPPTVASSIGSSPGPTAGGLPGAGLGFGEASPGSTASVELAENTAKDTVDLADPELGKEGEQTSPGRTGALPEVAATPTPPYPSKGTS